MKMFYLPSCPYCGVKLGKAESFVTKNKSLYRCLNCEKTSQVGLKNGAYKIIFPAQVAAVSAFVTAVLLGEGFLLWGLTLIVLDLILFYGLSPYLITLKEPKLGKKGAPVWVVVLSELKKLTQKRKTKKICINEKIDIEKTSKTEDKDNFTDIFSS